MTTTNALMRSDFGGASDEDENRTLRVILPKGRRVKKLSAKIAFKFPSKKEGKK